MSTRQLQELQGHVKQHTPVEGNPTHIWQADVTAVNADGTVTLAPVYGRAGKVNVPTPAGYNPTVGDRVLATNINGDKQTPAVLASVTTTPPTITGSRSGGAALQNLLTALAAANLIVDHTTA